MKAVKVILMILAVIFVIWLAASALSPSHAHLERSLEIKAPPQVVFDQVNNLGNWEKWSYWNELEPDAKKTYEGPEAGVGSKYSWEGKKTGKGSMVIVESVAPQTIKTELDFGGDGQAKSGFLFEPFGQGTRVTWDFDSDLGFTQRVSMMLMMDKFLGEAYEKGLDNLKKVCEGLPSPASKVEEVTLTPQWVITVRDTTDLAGISAKIGEAYQIIMGFMASKGLKNTSQPLAIWHKFDPEANFADMEPGVPVADSVAVGKGMHLIKMNGNAVKTTHWGAYEDAEPAYEALEAYMEQKGIAPKGDPWEVYITDPMQEKDTARWQTDIYFPI